MATDLQAGHRIRDNDLRQNGRTLLITSVNSRYVFAENAAGLSVRILAHRIYTDDKTRRTGFQLIRDDVQQWKVGNEYLPFHPDASHVPPDYRDGWNACYRAAKTARFTL